MARRTLPESTKQGILDGLKSGVSPVLLAQQFQVSVPTIYNYKKSQLNTVVAQPTVAAEANVESTATAGLAIATATRKASKRSVR